MHVADVATSGNAVRFAGGAFEELAELPNEADKEDSVSLLFVS